MVQIHELDSAAPQAADLLVFSTADASLTRQAPLSAMPYQLDLAAAPGRPLAAKLGEWPSVRDFGAAGDGIADDSTAFLNVLAFDSDIIALPPGLYRLTQPLTLRAGQSLIGHDQSSCFLQIEHTGDAITCALSTDSNQAGGTAANFTMAMGNAAQGFMVFEPNHHFSGLAVTGGDAAG